MTNYLQCLTRRMIDESLGKSWSNENFYLCLITPIPQEFNQLFEGAEVASQSKRSSSMKKLKGEGWDKHLISSWIKVFNQWVITNFWLRNVGTERPNPDIPQKTSRRWATIGFHQRTDATCRNYHNVILCWVGITYFLINTDGYPPLLSLFLFQIIVKP